MHVMRNFRMNRRQVLRGLMGGMAATVALPPLEAMLNAHGDALAGGEQLPKRFLSIMFGCGVMLERWEPSDVGADWTLSPQLAPFQDVKDYLTVCTGMRNNFGGGAITHHEGMCVFNGYDFVLRPDLPGFASDWGGPTIDQVIADAIEAQGVNTATRSLQLGWTKFDSPADNGSTAKALSARGTPGNLTILYPDANPMTVWQTLFGEFSLPKDDREQRLSILDVVAEDTARLRMELGTKDQQRLDAHLQGVSELEGKISAMMPLCMLPGQPKHPNAEANSQEQLILVNDLMSDLLAHAFLCDVTRVASYHMLSVASEVQLGDLGHSTTQHGDSHMGDENYHNGIVFIMTRIADLFRKLRDTEDVDGTNLLDSSIIFGSSEVSQGWSHSWQRQPIIIGGHGRGHLVHPGIHYQAIPQSNPQDDQTAAGNTSDILLTLLRAFDPEAESVGGGAPISTGVLDEIMA